MRDDLGHLLAVIATLVGVAIVFAIAVVVLTRSDLALSGNDPVNRHADAANAECYEFLRDASTATAAGRVADAHRSLALAESLSCSHDVRFRVGQLFRQLHDPETATRVLQDLAIELKTPEVYAELTGAFLDAGAVDSARASFARAASLPGALPETVRSLAWMALHLQCDTEASELFARALELFPEDPELWRTLSSVRLQSGDSEGAYEAAGHALSLAPGSCGAHLAMGWSLEALEDTAGAVRFFTRAVALCPNDSMALFEAGRFHYRAKRYGDAIPLLTRASQGLLCPLEWLLMLSRSQVGAGEIGGARNTLQLACERFRADYRPVLALARLERWHGDSNEARVLARRAHQLAPDDPEVSAFLRVCG